MNDHGVEYRTRRDASPRARSRHARAVDAGRARASTASTCRFPSTWQWPKPVQRNGPPVLIGGAAGPKLFEHIADYADGWIPIGGRGLTIALPQLP